MARALVPDRTRSDFISAVSEVAANGILHGRPPVRVRVWASLSRLVATVTNQGDGLHRPALTGQNISGQEATRS